jgi:hypothetical protein
VCLNAEVVGRLGDSQTLWRLHRMNSSIVLRYFLYSRSQLPHKLVGYWVVEHSAFRVWRKLILPVGTYRQRQKTGSSSNNGNCLQGSSFLSFPSFILFLNNHILRLSEVPAHPSARLLIDSTVFPSLSADVGVEFLDCRGLRRQGRLLRIGK